MPVTERLSSAALDIPTLFFAAVCIAALLGLLLIFAWLQERSTRALAWWGAAYLIGSSAMALWNAPEPFLPVPAEITSSLIFIACGMIWNGVRLFHGRRVLPLATFAGALIWLIVSHLPAVADNAGLRAGTGAFVVAGYTFAVAFELWRERRKSLFSRTAAIVVPFLHAMIFLMPIAMKLALPESLGGGWLEVFALEIMLYAVGTAFIVLMMVKNHQVGVQRTAASTDPLTGLLNRRAFLEAANQLAARQLARRQPVTVLMFDLDHFKSINDRFGHAIGDAALRTFAATVRTSMRASDVVGRLGGEEFAAIVGADCPTSLRVAERVRESFQAAGVEIEGQPLAATVSIGAACSTTMPFAIEPLLARADAALYRAKSGGRNRVEAAPDEHQVVAPPLVPAAGEPVVTFSKPSRAA